MLHFLIFSLLCFFSTYFSSSMYLIKIATINSDYFHHKSISHMLHWIKPKRTYSDWSFLPTAKGQNNLKCLQINTNLTKSAKQNIYSKITELMLHQFTNWLFDWSFQLYKKWMANKDNSCSSVIAMPTHTPTQARLSTQSSGKIIYLF